MNPDVENYLKKISIEHDNKHMSKTYLYINDEISEIIGYYSLALKTVSFEDESIPKSLIQKLHGYSKNCNRIVAVLIGQLGKNFSIKNNPLNMKIILNDIFNIYLKVQELAGCRVLLLECEEREKLVKNYESNGFKILQKRKDKELLQMYQIIK